MHCFKCLMCVTASAFVSALWENALFSLSHRWDGEPALPRVSQLVGVAAGQPRPPDFSSHSAASHVTFVTYTVLLHSRL